MDEKIQEPKTVQATTLIRMGFIGPNNISTFHFKVGYTDGSIEYVDFAVTEVELFDYLANKER